MSKPGFYVTTPIYYVTDGPHVGNAYTTIAADVIARYKRLCGYDVHFLTGTDEHGLKIQRAAQEEGISPRELADRVVDRFHAAWKRLRISYDDFIRTTEPRHERVVQHVFQRLLDSGNLYLGKYKGWYCVPCESFIRESREKPVCPECGRPAEWNAEPCYFFRLSRYQKPLLALYAEQAGFVQPPSRMNEVRSRVERELRDLSVSRTTLEWAVPLPFDPRHRSYVWVDALINYVSAVGFATDEAEFSRRWPADVHLIGKDILWFHAAIWPSLLMAIGVPLPKRVFAHGFWTHNGEKMSKSKGNFVKPDAVADEYGADALRYFLLRELPFGQDGDYRDATMHQRYNAELAGDLGNLVYRTLSMIEQYCDGVVPEPVGEPGGPLAEAAASLYEDVNARMAELQYSRTLERIWEFVRRANRYVEERKPWQLAKDPQSAPRLAATMYHLAEAMRILSLLLEPTMPETAEAVRCRLGLSAETAVLEQALAWGRLPPGCRVHRGKPLFPKKD